MHLVLIGASGKTGTEVVRQASAAGRQVTAFVCDPAKLTVRDDVRVKTGDARNAADLRAALEGQDAAVAAIGALRGRLIDPAMAALVQAAGETGVRRVVLMSSLIVAPNYKATGAAKLLGGLMKGSTDDMPWRRRTAAEV